MTILHYQILSTCLAVLLIYIFNRHLFLKRKNVNFEQQILEYKERFSTVFDAENVAEKIRSDIEKLLSEANQIRLNAEKDANQTRSNAERDANNTHREIESLKSEYKEKKKTYDKLVRAVAVFDEEVELAELGFYKPHFDFNTSDKFKEAINQIRSEQKEMLKNKKAIYCNTEWVVEGSRSKGETMINRAIRLTARAFNNECDSAVSSVRWNNISRMEKRIESAYEAINKLNQSINTNISHSYLRLKLKELRLTHEYHEKKQYEKEEQAELRRQEREEAQLLKEAAEAAKEEKRYASLLKKAQDQAATATDSKLEKLNKEIANLTAQLEAAHAKSERAISMAQQTKAGYVYVISNVGSFGENIYKIGMTRRLDPMDRVKELGDASVPFIFDTHAMIYSEDAPGMESQLHRTFEGKRINKVNNRKEFFRVTLEEVRSEVARLFPDADFVESVEARDFKETRALENKQQNVKSKSDAILQFAEEL